MVFNPTFSPVDGLQFHTLGVERILLRLLTIQCERRI